MTKSVDLQGLQKFAQEFVQNLKSGEKACVVGLSGDLGSGKTTFTQMAAKELGVIETVTSPTFVIEKIYPLDKLGAGKFKKLIHIDAYRLESGKELLSLGWQEIISDPKNLILIEWPERVADILPKDMKKLSFKFVDEERREVGVE